MGEDDEDGLEQRSVYGPAAAPGSIRPRATRRRRVMVDPATRRHDIVDEQEVVHPLPESGVLYSERAVDTYSIEEDRPLSATVHCGRETTSVGPSAEWRVAVEAKMSCDQTSFHVEEAWTAFEGGEEFFSRTRTYRIRRRGI